MDGSTIINGITQLGVAGFSIYVLWKTSDLHSLAMKEEREANREVEREVRTSIMNQLSENTAVMGRVINHLDRI